MGPRSSPAGVDSTLGVGGEISEDQCLSGFEARELPLPWHPGAWDRPLRPLSRRFGRCLEAQTNVCLNGQVGATAHRS